MMRLTATIFVICVLCLSAQTGAIPQTNDGIIAVHPRHPQVAQRKQYDNRDSWVRPSTQVHWAPSPGLSHAHAECKYPYAGMIARAPITLDCQVQAFHLTGRVEVFSYGLIPPAATVEWDRPEPMIGDPTGVVIRQVKVTFDTSSMPLSGVWHPNLTARAHLDNGTRYDATQAMAMCVACDGTEPEEAFWIETHVASFMNASPLPGLHGSPTVRYLGFLPIIADLLQRYDVSVQSFSYLLEQGQPAGTFPGTGAFEQVHRPNLHFGDPGILFNRLVAADPIVGGIVTNVIFDPVALGPGLSKVSAAWKHDTGNGSARFSAGEEFMAFIVVEVTVPGSTPPPTDPVPCGGTWGWSFTDNADKRFFTRVFTVSPSSPANCVRPVTPVGG